MEVGKWSDRGEDVSTRVAWSRAGGEELEYLSQRDVRIPQLNAPPSQHRPSQSSTQLLYVPSCSLHALAVLPTPNPNGPTPLAHNPASAAPARRPVPSRINSTMRASTDIRRDVETPCRADTDEHAAAEHARATVAGHGAVDADEESEEERCA